MYCELSDIMVIKRVLSLYVACHAAQVDAIAPAQRPFTYVPAHGLAGDQSNVDGDQREALHLDVQPLGKTVAVAGRRSHSKGEVRANPPRLPVHARWNDRTGAWQAIRIEDGSTKSKPRPLRWGDRIYLSSVAGAGPAPHLHADPTVPDEERRCVAQWHDRGVWQEVEVLRALATP